MFGGVWGGIKPKHWILTKKSICPHCMGSRRGTCLGRGCLGGLGGGGWKAGQLELQSR